MAKVTNQEIIDFGFTKDMFRQSDENAFKSYVDSIIAEIAAILSGRIGEALYSSAISPTAEYVKRAEKCLVAAEMLQRRINFYLGSVDGTEGLDLFKVRRQREEYVTEAETLIAKIVAGVTTDSSSFSFGTVTTSHFVEDSDA
ncbi:MAG: hypothetical protein AB1553_02005 [Nitrospirota bacterium]